MVRLLISSIKIFVTYKENFILLQKAKYSLMIRVEIKKISITFYENIIIEHIFFSTIVRILHFFFWLQIIVYSVYAVKILPFSLKRKVQMTFTLCTVLFTNGKAN